MEYPDFFDQVQTIKLKDKLSAFLGSAKGGDIEISYLEVSKMAGHSCPTVAGAYLMTLKAINYLYDGSVPIRGEIMVEFSGSQQEGVVGVMSSVITNITGACSDFGFKGLNGEFSRNNLLVFNSSDLNGIVRFTRVDSGVFVDVDYNPNVVLVSIEQQQLMQKVMCGYDSEDERKEFQRLWQDRVKRILIDNFDNQELIILK